MTENQVVLLKESVDIAISVMGNGLQKFQGTPEEVAIAKKKHRKLLTDLLEVHKEIDNIKTK